MACICPSVHLSLSPMFQYWPLGVQWPLISFSTSFWLDNIFTSAFWRNGLSFLLPDIWVGDAARYIHTNTNTIKILNQPCSLGKERLKNSECHMFSHNFIIILSFNKSSTIKYYHNLKYITYVMWIYIMNIILAMFVHSSISNSYYIWPSLSAQSGHFALASPSI